MSSAHIEDHELIDYVKKHSHAESRSNICTHLQRCLQCGAKLRALLASHVADHTGLPTSLEDNRVLGQSFKSGQNGSTKTYWPLSRDSAELYVSDVSKGGFGAITSNSLPLGSLVRVRIGESIVWGEVRFCRATSDKNFHIGVYVKTANVLGI